MSTATVRRQLVRLNLGCGPNFVPGFTGVDLFHMPQAGDNFVQADMCSLPFPDNYADYVESIAAFEHISFRRILDAFREVRRVLKPGGKFVMVTTNFDDLAERWVSLVRNRSLDNQETVDHLSNLMEVIYGNQLAEGEYHLMPFNPPFLVWLLINSGWKVPEEIRITVHPTGSRELSKLMLTQEIPEGAGCRTEMILLEAVKTYGNGNKRSKKRTGSRTDRKAAGGSRKLS